MGEEPVPHRQPATDVPGVQPAVLVQDLSGAFRVFQVAPKHVEAADADLTFAVGGKVAHLLHVQQLHHIAGEGGAHVT